MVNADALAVHLNFLEEIVQPEGNRFARGCRAELRSLIESLRETTPVIVKETGAGISPTTARWIADSGAAALDVGGRGGTSFAALEGQRAARQRDKQRATIGELFRDWGIPTPVSVVAAATCGLPVIATGGIRNGLDMAKAITLGASLVGVARPMLQAAQQGDDAIAELIEQLLAELRLAMFLTGSASPSVLRKAPRVCFGQTQEWLSQLNLLPVPAPLSA